MKTTESLLKQVSRDIQSLNAQLGTLNPAKVDFNHEFKRIDFIPTLEASIGETLPDLRAEDAASQVSQLLSKLSIPTPALPTLPRLLDKLCAEYLEPLCMGPTYIINHPECMSPLAKSYQHPTCNQIVSARAELFVDGWEMANMYEEENSPFEQRRKFEEQLLHRDPETPGEVDEDYVKVLEWGLPPTGGWGCGIDRLCMLMTGARRIGDVLSFGNLRSVTRSDRKVLSGRPEARQAEANGEDGNGR
jgi:lysyl-tRNA synthetase class 2